MSISLKAPTRQQTRGEEIANSISHGIALIAAIAATPYLIVHAVQHGATGYIVGVSIFAASMILLYLSSTIYHSLPHGRTKRLFQVIEHSAIFFLIAGTYTPFTLGVIRGPVGWTVFGLIWGLAVIGVMLKAFDRLFHPIFSTGLYLLMGWLIVVAINPLTARVSTAGLTWLAVGGVAYTAGVAFFVTDSRIKYGHFVWHLFVMTGTICHFCSIFWYAA